jgi:N-acyl-D-aspartate/D-glutamate deacylase
MPNIKRVSHPILGDEAMNYEVVIKNGRIVDGTGSPWFHGDVGIKSGKIAHVGRVGTDDADEVIDAKGLIISPGIVDIHSHSDYSILENPRVDSFIRQGITTILNGNCGMSAAPLNEEALKGYVEMMNVKIDWLSMTDYLDKIERNGVAINVATCTGLTNLLIMTMGYDAWDRPPSRKEVKAMGVILEQSMREGSLGLSSGLEYPPQTMTTTRDLIELSKVVAEKGGFYVTHIRSRDEQVEAAAREAIEIGERSGASVEGVHWGARFPSDGKTKLIVDMVVAARHRGVDIGINQVPWTMDEEGVGWCGCQMIDPITSGSRYTLKGKIITAEMLRNPEVVEYLRTDLHNRQYGPILAAKRGLFDSWDRVLLAHCEKSPQYNGLNMREIGKLARKDPFDTLIDILAAEGDGLNRVWGAVGITSLWDTEFSLLHPLSSIAIDSSNNSLEGPLSDLPVGEETTRAFGQFPYFFNKWVAEKHALGLEEVVRKCTGLPAQRMRLMDRGLIRPGMWADIMVWSLDKIRDNSTWQKPRAYPSGISKVLVNGAVVVDENKHSGALGGKVLRRANF